MGYGFVSLLQSKENLGVLDELLIMRGLTSPAGHLSWTGLVCAVLTAVALHALWDTFASIRSATFVESLSVELLSLSVALVSLVLLIQRMREARRAGA